MNKDRRLYYIVFAIDMAMMLLLNVVMFHFMYERTPIYLPSFGLRFTSLILFLSYLVSFSFRPPISQLRINSAEGVVRNVLITSMIFGVLTAVMITIFYPSQHFPRTYFLTFIIIYTILLLIERLSLRKFFMYIRAKRRNQYNIVLLGDSDGIIDLFHYLSQPIYGYNIKGHFGESESKDSGLAKVYQGQIDTIFNWLSTHNNIAEIYAYMDPNNQEKINMLSKYCDNNLIRFYYVPKLNIFRGQLSFSRYGNTPVVARRREPLTFPINKFIKRLFDIIFSFLVLTTIFPIIFIISAIKIKRQSPGPIFFKQLRTGLDGKSFYCWKFRSMHVNKDADTLQATKDDPRKFSYGNFMRKTNIDELPQFINVLLGDMSVVGPRPHMVKHTEEYSSIINRYMVRHLAKPGITGLAQVSGFRGETQYLSQMEDRVKKDIEYIENWSLLLDIKIILKTLTNAIHGEEKAY